MKLAIALGGAALSASLLAAVPASAQNYDPFFDANQPSVFGVIGDAIGAGVGVAATGVGVATAPFTGWTGAPAPVYSGRSSSNYPASLDDDGWNRSNKAYRVYRQSPYQPYN